MSFEIQKIRIIKQLLHVEDDAVLAQITKLVEEALHNGKEFAPSMLSPEEYFRRQDEAEEDARTGNVVPQHEVKAFMANRLQQPA